MSIYLSEAAAIRIRNRLQARGHGEGIRLGVKHSGCAGLAYVVDYADTIASDDLVFESHGTKIIVNSDDLIYVNNTEVDYKEKGLSSSFHFKNPNMTDECGCGESFTVSNTN